MPLLKSWVKAANTATCPFPLNNLPYGVFSTPDSDPRCGVAIGDMILDIAALEESDLLGLPESPVFDVPFWNDFMELGPGAWRTLRSRLTALLAEGAPEQGQLAGFLVPLADAELHLPFLVSEFTDFYSGRHHAYNVGCLFRGPDNALPPNWDHLPIGYNGRASSVYVSGTNFPRPYGQLRGPDDAVPRFSPSQKFDIEVELGAIIGTPSNTPLTVAESQAAIFGYVLLNDWSARDIQAWEYQPLGPFQAKATATTISPWIVTAAALDPFRCPGPALHAGLLPHLSHPDPRSYDIEIAADLTPAGGEPTRICTTNSRYLTYSAAQQLAHHTTSGCPMNAGDLLGSGTISGPEKHQRGALIELTWGGAEPLTLANGDTRSFLADNDTITLTAAAHGDGYEIGFGPCSGTLLPAVPDPYARP